MGRGIKGLCPTEYKVQACERCLGERSDQDLETQGLWGRAATRCAGRGVPLTGTSPGQPRTPPRLGTGAQTRSGSEASWCVNAGKQSGAASGPHLATQCSSACSPSLPCLTARDGDGADGEGPQPCSLISPVPSFPFCWLSTPPSPCLCSHPHSHHRRERRGAGRKSV